MSVLREAHDVVINGGEIFSIQNAHHSGSTGIDILRKASTPEAAVDAEERSYAPSCFPRTRDQYIDDITDWAKAGSNENVLLVYWMKGPAGVGKSAVAQTCAAKLKDEGQLGAAFFFSINGRRKDHSRFFPALAYQLSTVYDDYREIVNRKVSVDQTLVKKRISSQFKSLIVEPLWVLKEQGREIQRTSIFIDGLDECESQRAQVEIIQIIASSVRNGTTPFRWAIFSREEPHIVSAFADLKISSHCSVFLPISRDADEEIELYLRGGFRNILRRRNLLNLSSSWPVEEDIRKLVDAAAGLFAHSATVLRFIDCYSHSGFKESLEAVLASIANPGTKTVSIYGELDRLYTLILQRVPGDICPAMLIFLSEMVLPDFNCRGRYVAHVCNMLGISGAVFQSIRHHLQAVLTIRDPPQLMVDNAISPERSYDEQRSNIELGSSLDHRILAIRGIVDFRHKSFYEFLTDPDRSSTFCATSPAVRGRIFNQYIQQHSRYASSYTVRGSKLVLALGLFSSSVSLSWPQGSEFVDSCHKLSSLITISFHLSHDFSGFGQFLRDVPFSSLQKLARIDYRKYLIALQMGDSVAFWKNADVVGCAGVGTWCYTGDAMFTCIDKYHYDVFNPAAFLRMVSRLEEAGVIRPYNIHLGSSWATALLRAFSRQKLYGRSYGQYKMGHGDKSVVWYWEFDTEKRYFHEFQTVNFAKAMAYYKAEKFEIWERRDEDYVSSIEEDDSDEDGQAAM